MATILNGRVARDELKKKLAIKIAGLKSRGIMPTLTIVQVGNRADSTAYINAKKKFGADIGVEVRHIHLPEAVSDKEIIDEINKLNEDNLVNGIVLQLPLPEKLKAHTKDVVDSIDSTKDVDAITSKKVSEWQTSQNISEKILWPATARGVGELMDFYRINISDKKVCVIGRSALVGTPVAALCRAKGALVTVCHSKTGDLKKETLSADIIVSAVGKIGLITAKHVKPGQIIIDIGINEPPTGGGGNKLDEELPSRRLVGDVDFAAVAPILGNSGAITPVPGGVGPMTVLALFENLADLVKTYISKSML